MADRFSVLKPELIWIGDRCYRKMPVRQKSKEHADTEDLYPDEGPKLHPEEVINEISIKHGVNNFYNVVHAPESLVHELRIASRKILANLRTEDVKISIPRAAVGVDAVEITITGPKKRGVYEGSRQIMVVIDSARLRSPFTHFVSLPMNFENIQQSFLDFKGSVLGECRDSRGLTEDIFQDPRKLHFTVVTLVLLDTKDRETAVATLQKCKNKINDILRDNPLTVRVKGIEYMNDDPSEVDVLYAKVEPDRDACLQAIVDLLLDEFKRSKVTGRHDDSVKLHTTLINTLFRHEEDDVVVKKERVTFDARRILENFADFEFGAVTLSEIHISIRYTRADNGYYRSSSVLKLPMTAPKY